MGCAPSHELLATWTKRETDLVDVYPAQTELTSRNFKPKGIRRILPCYHKQRELIWGKKQVI